MNNYMKPIVSSLKQWVTEYIKNNPGADGKDGVSPTVTTSKSGKVTTITITDATGTKTATINDGSDGATGPAGAAGPAGADGYTPVRGTDYWTAEDQSQIVSDVLAALPNASGVSF